MRAVRLDGGHGLVVDKSTVGVVNRAVTNAVETGVSHGLEMKGVSW